MEFDMSVNTREPQGPPSFPLVCRCLSDALMSRIFIVGTKILAREMGSSGCSYLFKNRLVVLLQFLELPVQVFQSLFPEQDDT